MHNILKIHFPVVVNGHQALKYAVFILSAANAVFLFAVSIQMHYTQIGADWERFFLLSTIALFSGENPYTVPEVFSPPWTFIILGPFALLPPLASGIAVGLMSYLSAGYLAYRLGAKLETALLVMFSAPVFLSFQLSQVDWIVWLGLFMPPQIGLFFVLTKPQAGIGMAIYWLFESWRKGKIREVARVFAPVSIGYLLSFALFKYNPLDGAMLNNAPHNTSFFPFSIIIGIILIYFSIRQRQKTFSLSASPFFSPYVNVQTWAVLMFGLVKYPWAVLIANILLWVLLILTNDRVAALSQH
jgi:hypothetical protein